MTTSLMPEPRQRYYTNTGTPAAGCKLYTYAAGTSTPKATYQDSAGTVPHTNPITLDSKGEAVIYWSGAYKVDLKTATGVQITGYPVDNYVAPADLTAATGTTLVKGTWFGGVIAYVSDLATSIGSSLIGFIQAGAGAILRSIQDKLRERVSVMDFGAVGDGVNDDTEEIRAARNFAYITGRALHFPTPPVEYLATSTIDIEEYCPIIGDSAGLLSQYLGRQKGGSRIKYTGTGPCFYVKPNPAPGTTTRLAYGQQFKNLIIQGTAAGSHGIKVSDSANINVAGMDLAGLQIDNVFVYDFKAGRALEVNYCFNNSIKNFVAETCGVAATLRYAHNTSFFGGSLEQSLVGLDAITTIDINLHGTCMQGIDTSRIASQGLSMPTDFFLWTGGWDGTGTSGVVRTTAAHYAGIGVRNFGSTVRWFGGYEEGNTIGYLTELGSDTAIYGKVVDLDTPVTYFAQFGIGAFAAHNVKFAQGDKSNLVGVFHTERNYAAPIRIDNPNFADTVVEGKKFTGPQTHVGIIDNYLPLSFRGTRILRLMDVSVPDGTVSHKGGRALGGFNTEFRESLANAAAGVISKDFATDTTGLNLMQVVDATDLTITFSDAARKVVGAPLRVTIINTSATTAATIRFSLTDFGPGSTAYSLPARKQRVFKFFYDNGVFLEEGVDVAL